VAAIGDQIVAVVLATTAIVTGTMLNPLALFEAHQLASLFCRGCDGS
jgi:hypothetical protein